MSASNLLASDLRPGAIPAKSEEAEPLRGLGWGHSFAFEGEAVLNLRAGMDQTQTDRSNLGWGRPGSCGWPLHSLIDAEPRHCRSASSTAICRSARAGAYSWYAFQRTLLPMPFGSCHAGLCPGDRPICGLGYVHALVAHE